MHCLPRHGRSEPCPMTRWEHGPLTLFFAVDDIFFGFSVFRVAWQRSPPGITPLKTELVPSIICVPHTFGVLDTFVSPYGHGMQEI